MAEYTYEDIIIDPTSDRAKEAVGKEVYYDDSPSRTLFYSNTDCRAGILVKIDEHKMCPFLVKYEDDIFGYGCIIVKKEDTYEVRAKKWIEENNLKVGDYVKVLRKTELHENRWGSFWVDEMSDYIGKALKVLAINSLNGLICLECDDTGYDFPYFVLEKVEEPKTQYVPFESKEEFIEAFHYHDVSKYSDTDNILLIYGMWIKCKESSTLFLVTMIKDEGLYTEHSYYVFSWENVLTEYEFLDGSPCGKLMEDKND